MDMHAENRTRRSPWDVMYDLARAYYVSYGDLNVPSNYVTHEGEKLGAWVAYQRTKRSRGELEEEKIARLDAIGMEW